MESSGAVASESYEKSADWATQVSSTESVTMSRMKMLLFRVALEEVTFGPHMPQVPQKAQTKSLCEVVGDATTSGQLVAPVDPGFESNDK